MLRLWSNSTNPLLCKVTSNIISSRRHVVAQINVFIVGEYEYSRYDPPFIIELNPYMYSTCYAN